MARATTVRFTDEMHERLDQAAARTGLPVNSIVIAACLEWMQRHTPGPAAEPVAGEPAVGWQAARTGAPRWATLRRAVKLAVAGHGKPGTSMSMYPFARFTDHAKELLTFAQAEAEKSGYSYIGTEHLLLASFGRPDFHSARVLAALGIEEAAARSAIDGLIGRKTVTGPRGNIPTSRVKRVIEIAFGLNVREDEGKDERVGTHHVLLALMLESEGIAGRVLTDLGATRKRMESEILKLAEPEP